MPPPAAGSAENWEPAWSSQHERWYYQDRNRGLSSWKRPPNCTITLPSSPPAGAMGADASRALPPGWRTEWDTTHNKSYFYNTQTGVRTWKIEDVLGQETESSPAPVRPLAATYHGRGGKGGGKGHGHGGGAPAAGAWNPEDFKRRLDRAKSTGERNMIKGVLKEVAENNYTLRSQWPVSRTVSVSLEECLRSRLSGAGTDPQISFSTMTTADALLHLSLNGKRQVCGLNFANGEKIGGGYKNGAIAQEEDLCRRMPNLYTTLFNAKKEGFYPFGPCTCTRASEPRRYSDVLWTPNVVIARSGEEDGFAFLPHEKQVTTALVAAAAPNIRFANPPELYDKNLMLNTVKAVLMAPIIKDPQMNAIVLGAWGCGAFGGDPNDIAELFIKALVDEKLGRLYKEVHFAIPEYGTDQNSKTFRDIFRKRGIRFTEIA